MNDLDEIESFIGLAIGVIFIWDVWGSIPGLAAAFIAWKTWTYLR